MNKQIISLEDVRHVAKLARIAMSEEELKKYQVQLERILAHIAKLKEKNTEGVLPTAHPYETATPWREDIAKPFADLEALFKNAPEMEETFYRVKKVIE
ncbi:MAG: Glutamyl-tRNA(Gln) amidotransferase subunit C [Elusimicrobia bacterium]|nr:Glutamyl-tRNA(Gln) amidotransferase subunit C [Elusimicrobiota bacterium]